MSLFFRMQIKRIFLDLVFFIACFFFFEKPTLGVTANNVWFEFHQNFYRVVFEYTLPEIKEYREAYVEFTSKRKAEIFYWKLVKGADVFLGDPDSIKFIKSKDSPDPW